MQSRSSAAPAIVRAVSEGSTWRYPFFTPALGKEARELAAGIETPLRLDHRHRWDPEELSATVFRVRFGLRR